MDNYISFKEFFCPWWSASPSTYYKILGYSRSKASVYILRDRLTMMVPVDVVNFHRITI